LDPDKNMVNSLRLAICSVGELYGGVERQILDLCAFLDRSGAGTPLVVLFHDRELARQLRETGIDPVIISGRNRYDFGMLGRLKDLLMENRINVVHAHGYKATIACGLIKDQVGFRLVKTEHGKREGTPANFLPWLKGLANFRLDQFITRRKVDFVAYVTRDIQGFFDRYHMGLARDTVHNGIDPLDSGSRPRPDDLPEGGLNFGIVGRVTQVKGIPFAIEALARPETGGSINLVILGTGGMTEELKDLAQESGVADRVYFLGFKSNIHDYLAHLDALMMPSFHEGLPYTLLEAMSLGKPVIASRVGGLQEVLEDGRTGFLVDVGDVAGLSRAMNSLAGSGEIRSKLGEQGRKEQAEKYTLAIMGQKYLDCYSG